MSKKSNNEIELNKIVAPSLSEVGYASSLNEVFNNIDSNFTTLANRDFVKGETGDSLNSKIVYFFDEEGNLTEYGKKLKECIESVSTEKDRMSIYDNYSNEISLWDNFNENPGHLLMMFGINSDVTNDVEEPLSSFYYVFLDGRFATNKLQYINQDQYASIKDLSCVLIYDAAVGGFKALIDAFPTIYFQTNVGLCWKINGVNTGLAVQGVQGKRGLNSPIYVVRCNDLELKDSLLSGEVNAIFDNFEGYKSIDKNDVQEYEHLIDSTCLIFTQDINDTQNGNKFYFGTIGLKNNILHAYCNPYTAINDNIRVEDFNNAMKNISLKNSDANIHTTIKGLYIPITNEDSDKAQPVHLLSSVATTEKVKDLTDNKNDVIFAPINNINTVSVEDNNLIVDKYMYLKVNSNSSLFDNDTINMGVYKTVKNEFGIKKYNYVLKYKLIDVVKELNYLYEDANTIDVNPNFDIYYPNKDNGGSRYFPESGVQYVTYDEIGNIVSKENVKLSDENTLYFNAKTGKYYQDTWTTMPAEFKDRMKSIDSDNNIGIYRWELCSVKNEWDVEDMYSNETEDNYIYSDNPLYNENPNEFARVFKTIYTTNIIPDSSSKFMWYNAICLDPTHDTGYHENRSLYIIPGWNYNTFTDVFEFVKYIAIYNNDFSHNTNNTLNLNYDVNITGDSLNPNKNLFVNGSIACNTIECKSLMNIINELQHQIDNLQTQLNELKNDNTSDFETP